MTREGLAARILDMVAHANSTAEASVSVSQEHRALTRFAESFIHQNVADESERVALQLHVDGRTASATTNQTSGEALSALVTSCLAATAASPIDPGWAGLTPRMGVHSAGNWDEATATAAPAARASVVRSFVDAAAGLACAGYCQTVSIEAVFANSAGHAVTGRSTQASADAIARTGRSDGAARTAAIALSDVDGAALGTAAAAKARAGQEQVALDPGRYEVVLEPGAVADLVAGLLSQGLNGKAVVEGRSFVQLGAQQFDRAVSLWDDGTDSRAVGPPFDAEGTPKRRLDLVSDGVTTGVPHDRRTAAAYGTETTGHAVEGGERWGALPADVRLAAGSVDDLVADVERGLLVSDFWYTRALDPKTLVYTGLTRNGVWLIEDGRLGSALSTLRFTQSYVDALQPGAVLGVSRSTESSPRAIAPAAGGLSSLVVPSLRLASWNITGGAAG
ncbi:MAG: TldD/PmbA family protein [Geodermatophilaceae bacterium]|nr:TldD/PmbA family protein [Geodermatophilaceae bacterium]